MNHRDLAGFSSAEFLKAYAGVFKKLVDDPDLFAERQPRAFLLGGQSGAGKTNLHKLLTDELGKNAIVINGDEYRSRHPRFAELDAQYGPEAVAYTAAWAGQMVEALVKALSSAR